MDENGDFDVLPDVNERQEIAPYQFEPEPAAITTDSDSGSDISEEESDDHPMQADELVGRVGNTNWWVFYCLFHVCFVRLKEIVYLTFKNESQYAILIDLAFYLLFNG